ncbi:non-homologous end joining protein Ku [Siccirubricoccus phaeus]|uniref:non-homologous end joining protein Ku n=1 Tax=Siccirubricoccus phaeus TaxID=2595053 RepID=UPI0011F2BDDF|nr:Ku protein [Siccirubricoccus phaeus]
MPEGHPIWRGHLRLALVSCPVALYSARHAAAALHFHMINPDTGNRIRMLTLDAGTGEELRRSELAKGYEFEKDRFVLLDEEDFARARIESSSLLTLDKFVTADAIDPIHLDASYYLLPDGEAGQDVYTVLQAAIAEAKRIGLARLVLSRRERSVAVMPLGRGLVLHTLNDPKELHDPAKSFADLPKAKPDAAMVKLARELIDRQTGEFMLEDMEDRYEARLREVIRAKLEGEEISEPAEEAPEDNVIDLMTALKRSLGQEERRAKPAAKKAPAAKPARRAAGGKRRA